MEIRIQSILRIKAPSARVLIVDDNRMNIRVVEGLLQEYELQVSYALSGIEALELLETKEYDLVFLDHMMPGMDGVETLHHIRKKSDPYYKNLPVIALTANAIAGAREMFLREGFNDFVPKPIESSVLLRALKRHIPLEKQSKGKPLAVKTAVSNKIEKISDITNINDNVEMFDYENQKEVSDIFTNEEHELMQSRNYFFDVKKNNEKMKNSLCIGNLDIKKGIVYCGNEKNYIQILKNHREHSGEQIEQLEQLYKINDWKNYTIAVHGVKSSMMSIGATQLSELAKQLELAGKNEDISYIQNYHKPMIEEYQAVWEMIIKWFEQNEHKTENSEKTEIVRWKKEVVKEPENEIEAKKDIENTNDISEKPILLEAEFDKVLVELEDAMYSLDGVQMFEILEQLEQFSYCGKDLEEVYAGVHKKIQMMDYMSAYEMIKQKKEQLSRMDRH